MGAPKSNQGPYRCQTRQYRKSSEMTRRTTSWSCSRHRQSHRRTCLWMVLSLLGSLFLLFPFLMLDKGLIKLFESILGHLPAFSPWFWRCKGIRKLSDHQVFFIKFFSQPFPQPFPFSATVPILTSWPYNKKTGAFFPCYSFPRYSSYVYEFLLQR